METYSFNNQGLFSNYYLDKRLPLNPLLWDINTDEIDRNFNILKELYRRIKDEKLDLPGEEAKLEDRFIRPVFTEVLGMYYDCQVRTQRGGKTKHPDQALFKSIDDYKKSEKNRKNLLKYWENAIFVSESKSWNSPLNPVKKEAGFINPTTQMTGYITDIYERILRFSRHIWGILTNGKIWRLHTTLSSNWAGNYFEIDLEEIINNDDIESFKYFYIIFGARSHDIIPQYNKSRLVSILHASIQYSGEIGEKIKDRIYESIFEKIANGFLYYRRNFKDIPDESDEIEGTLFEATLTLLFRFLFVLYAEARELLPVNQSGYYKFSMSKIANEAIEKLQKGELDKDGLGTWAKLRTLFKKINRGDSSCNLPIYNGGLFRDSGGYLDKGLKFLRNNELTDIPLAEVFCSLLLDNETTSEEKASGLVDYTSLGVRHLGEIYEGLLEFNIQIADKDMALLRDKNGREIWKLLSKRNRGKCELIRKKGEAYISNEQGERKQYGSYYTPDYIVKYIIRKTVSPVIEEKIDKIKILEKEIKKKLKEARRTDDTFKIRRLLKLEIEKIQKEVMEEFNIRILDPAMGSGHFLVSAVDFISNRLCDYVSQNPSSPLMKYIEKTRKSILDDLERQGVRIDEEKLTDDKLIKRTILKKCVYGVDLNPMAVELAKLSLWLDSFTLGAPLSFLDHHLKCGNSLVGSGNISSHIPDTSRRYMQFLMAVSNLLLVSEMTDSTISEVEESARLYEETCKWMEPTKERLHVDSAQHFGELAEILSGNNRIVRNAALGRAMDVAYKKSLREVDQKRFLIAQKISEKKRFFHWELEFPEVFFDRTGELENLGFDCVIGNPPYVRIQSLDDEEKKYYRKTFITPFKNFDIYILFVEKGVQLIKECGKLSYIMPNKFYSLDYGEKLRNMLSGRKLVKEIIDFGDNQIFPRQTTYTNLLFLSGKENNEIEYRKIEKLENPEKELPIIFEDDFIDSRCKYGKFEIINYSGKPWRFITEQGIDFDRIYGNSIPLGNLVKKIFVGVQTSADDVYILLKRKEDDNTIRLYSKSQNSEVILEKCPILRPLISGEDVDRYATPIINKYILFPYEIHNNTASLFTEDEISERYPLIYRYLKQNEGILSGREKGKMDYDKWYAFGRNQNIARQNKRKIGIAQTVKRLELFLDNDGVFCFHNVRVNGIVLKSDSIKAYHLILGILNSKLIDYLFKLGAARHRGGHYAANKQFIFPLPIHKDYNTFSEKERLIEYTGKIINNIDLLHHNLENFRDQLNYEYDIIIKHPDKNFYKKDFDDFISYLKSKNVDLKGKSLDLRSFFNSYSDRLRRMDNEIIKIDREIDNMIYDLYGLSAGERKIIESI